MGDTDIILAHLAVILAMVNKQLTKIRLMMPLSVSDKYFSDCSVLQCGVCGHVTFVTSVNIYYQDKKAIIVKLESIKKILKCFHVTKHLYVHFQGLEK